MSLVPEIAGSVKIRSEPEPFFRAFRRRVASGMLTGKRGRRSNYVVAAAGERRMTVHAGDLWSAINVGLNLLDLEWAGKETVRYRVRYWRWTLYCVGLGAVLGAIGIALLLAFDVRGYMTAAPGRMIPGLPVELNVVLLWLFVLFWGFVWPWILVKIHKRPLHALAQRLVAAVDESVASL
jgi:hypothetical protein